MAVNVNTADKEELLKLPNIGERRAQGILDLRGEKGTLTAQELLDDPNLSAVAQGLLEANQIVFTAEIVAEREGAQQLDVALESKVSAENQKDLFDLIRNVNANLGKVNANIAGLTGRVDSFQDSLLGLSNRIDSKVGELATKMESRDSQLNEQQADFNERLKKLEHSESFPATAASHLGNPISGPAPQSLTPSVTGPAASPLQPFSTFLASVSSHSENPTSEPALQSHPPSVNMQTASPMQPIPTLPPLSSAPTLSSAPSVGGLYASVKGVYPVDAIYQRPAQVTAPSTGTNMVQGVVTTPRVEGRVPQEPYAPAIMTQGPGSSRLMQGNMTDAATASSGYMYLAGNGHFYRAESHPTGTAPQGSPYVEPYTQSAFQCGTSATPYTDLPFSQPAVDRFSQVVQKQLSRAATPATFQTPGGRRSVDRTSGDNHQSSCGDELSEASDHPGSDEDEYSHYPGRGSHSSRGRSRKGGRDKRRKSPPPAKLPTFHGKATDDWIAFRVQFERIAHTYEWSLQTRLDKLIESLRGKATSFYGRLRRREREDYKTLRDLLEKRYGHLDPPHTLRYQLQAIRQGTEEELDEFAERVQQLAYEAHPKAADRTINDASVDSFLRGCKDKRAALKAMDRDPTTLAKAITLVKAAIHSRRALFGDTPKVRKVSFNETNARGETSDSEGSSGRVGVSNTTHELRGAVEKLSHMVENMSSWAQNPPRPGVTSPRRSQSPADSRCYRCGELGHFGRNCKLRSRSPTEFHCYRCGKPGHYGRDCVSSPSRKSAETVNPKENSVSSN